MAASVLLGRADTGAPRPFLAACPRGALVTNWQAIHTLTLNIPPCVTPTLPPGQPKNYLDYISTYRRHLQGQRRANMDMANRLSGEPDAGPWPAVRVWPPSANRPLPTAASNLGQPPDS